MFHSRRRSKQLPPSQVNVNGVVIPTSTKAKYLGIILDNRQTMRAQIEHSITKTNNSVRLLYLRRNNFATKKLKTKIYKCYIRPVFTYAAPIITRVAKSNILKLQRKQNSILRMVANKRRRTRIKDLHEHLAIEEVPQFMNRLNSKFTEKCTYSSNEIIRDMGRE